MEVPRTFAQRLLIGTTALLGCVVLYVVLAAYLPVRDRAVRLEAELRGLYGREAELQARVQYHERRQQMAEQQLRGLIAERDELARRLEVTEQQLAVLRGRRR